MNLQHIRVRLFHINDILSVNDASGNGNNCANENNCNDIYMNNDDKSLSLRRVFEITKDKVQLIICELSPYRNIKQRFVLYNCHHQRFKLLY